MANESKPVTQASFGRRSFVKGAAATLGLISATGLGCAPQQDLEKNDGACTRLTFPFFSNALLLHQPTGFNERKPEAMISASVKATNASTTDAERSVQ